MTDILVDDVMTRLVVTLKPETSLHEAAQRLAQHGISGAPVVVDGVVHGVVSEADLVRASLPPAPINRGLSILDMISLMGRGRATAHPAITVGDIMTSVVIEVPVGTSIWKAAEIMNRRGIKRLPVVEEDGQLVGIVSRGDLVRAIGRTDKQIALEVAHAIEVLGPENFDRLEVTVDDGTVTLSGTADRRSTKDIAVRIATRTPGAAAVIDRLDFSYDDRHGRHLPPQEDPKDPRLDWEKEEVKL